MVRNVFIITIGLLLLNCSNNMIMEPDIDNSFLDLYMDVQNNDGYYLVDYPNQEDNSYTAVYYKTLPDTRVFWASVDSFTVYHWGHAITEPIINFSTYSNSDGDGQQMIYLHQDFIGDTLMVYGCVENDVCSSLNFIIY